MRQVSHKGEKVVLPGEDAEETSGVVWDCGGLEYMKMKFEFITED